MATNEEVSRLDKVSLWGLGVGMGALLLTVLVVLVSWNRLPPELPFLYSLPVGEGQLILKNHLFYILPGFLGLWVINALAMTLVIKKETLLRQFLGWGGAVVQILLALTVINIIRVVT